MKKFKGLLLVLIVMLTNVVIVNATCETEEKNKLNSLAVNVKASYELVEEEVPLEEGFNYPDGMTEEDIKDFKNIVEIFKIYITNVTEELYVEVTNKTTKETKKYTYSEVVDGSIIIKQEVNLDINNYTIVVYSSDKTGCPDTKLHTLYLTTPAFNEYSQLKVCEGIEDFYLCHEYLSVETSFEKFDELVAKYKEGKISEDGEDTKDTPKEEPSFMDFIKENKGIIIGVTIGIVAIGGLVTVIIVKKQRSRIVWKNY